jgi:uncharacterized RDD family membrane protein YckC
MISLQESVGSDDGSYHQILPPGTFVLHNKVFNYPSLARRYKAMAIDFVVLLSIMITAMVILGENESRPTVMVLMTLALSFYEPVLSRYSATIGQRVMRIRIRNYDAPSQPVGFWQAYIRLWTKGILGWLSFLTVHQNPEHRAIHDVACSTVVIMLGNS